MLENSEREEKKGREMFSGMGDWAENILPPPPPLSTWFFTPSGPTHLSSQGPFTPTPDQLKTHKYVAPLCVYTKQQC